MQVREHVYLTSEAEPIFDAADVMRFGKDIFVHMGFTTNNSGFEWLRRHAATRGIRSCVCACACVCIHVCMYMRTCVHVYMCTYADVYMQMYTYIHTYIHAHP